LAASLRPALLKKRSEVDFAAASVIRRKTRTCRESDPLPRRAVAPFDLAAPTGEDRKIVAATAIGLSVAGGTSLLTGPTPVACFPMEPVMKRIGQVAVLTLGLGLVAGCGPTNVDPGVKRIQVALFVGKLDVANAKERKQGIEEVLKGTGVEIAETFTDQEDRSKCQEYVRNALDKYGDDLKCLVGLWSYNAPQILQVVKEKNLVGKIQIVAFDEEIPTLDAVEDGTIFSTVVQQPYQFGYQSIEVLSHLATGTKVDIPKDGLMFVPVKVIEKGGVREFRENVQKMYKEAAAPQHEGKTKLAFVTNGSSDFWKLAKAGVRKAEKDFDAQVEFHEPSQGTPARQQAIIESVLGIEGMSGIAISVLDPVGAISIIDKAAEKMPVVTQDSDAPDSKRRAYIGTDNVEAGRVAGREILKALRAAGLLTVER
jgi:ribose transport system substrate-binding protein